MAALMPAPTPVTSSTQGQTFGVAYQSFGHQPSIFGQVQPPIASTTFGGSIFGTLTSSDQSTATKRSCDQNTSKASDHRAHLKEKYTKSQTINANLSKDLEVLRDQIMKLEAENKKLKESGILADLKRIFHDEAFKDFTVNVNKEKSFKIHKLLFAARSSVIADMIRNNPEDFELNLQDIPLPIFEILLHFIYNDSAPDGDDNLIATYAAAGRLNIVDLKNLTAQKLMDNVDEKNAFRVLELSNKYGNDELRLKAFEEIKKLLSDYKLNDEFSKKPEKIKKFLDMKKKMDEEYEIMKQEF
jgi:speckle-type POZ protein